MLHLIFGQVEEAVMDNSMIYFLLTAISFPFIALFDAGGAFYRAAGNSRFPMMISVLSNGLNIAGNAVLIFGSSFYLIFKNFLCSSNFLESAETGSGDCVKSLS